MPNRFQSLTAARLLPLAAALLFVSAVPAAAQSEPTMMQKIFGAIGLLELPEEGIDYRERAPLVVPPSPALIQPRSPDDIAKVNPDWPLDVDRQPKKKGDIEEERVSEENFRSGRALSPAELRGNVKKATGSRKSTDKPHGPGVPDVDTAQKALSPTQLGFKGWGSINKTEERVVFTGEPDRRSLTDPPPGLRTPSQDAPYGVVADRPKAAKASTLYDRVEPSK